MAPVQDGGSRAFADADLESVYREHYRSLVRLARLPAYLRSAVLNGARSQLRRSVVARRHPPAAPDPAGDPGDRALAGDTHLVLAAVALGISTGSVKTHAHRGLAALTARLEDLR